MRKAQAEEILKEAKKDERLQVVLNTVHVRSGSDGGFRVDVTLRRERRRFTVSNPQQWEDIKLAWEGL